MVQVALDRERARAELTRRYQPVLDQITPLAMASGIVRGQEVTHEFCLKVLQSTARNLCLVCSRRAGKTYVICCLLLLTALLTPDSNSLYLALVSGQAKKVFQRIWKKVLRRFFPGDSQILVNHSETEMVTTFWNGSTVTFGGVDDLRHVQTLLGDSMAGGLAVIDEAQSGVVSVLTALVDDILGPMLDETNDQKTKPGRLIVAGTQPVIRAGYLYDLFMRIRKEQGMDGIWEEIRWTRFQNPFLTDNDKRLQDYLKKTGRKVEDPIVRANWYGEDVYDTGATAYRYDSVRNQWTGTWIHSLRAMEWFPVGTGGNAVFVQPPPGVDTFIVGLDPAATSDRFAIVLWGWSSISPQGLWQCGEWVTEKAANVLESVYLNVIKILCKHYRVIAIVRDAGSASTTQDPAFLAEYGLVIEPAKKGKGSVKARVDRLADLLGTGRARVLAGSELESDLKLARFDPDKRAQGKYEWTADCHPDVADAASYPIPNYIESIEVKKKSPAEIEAEQELASWNPPIPGYGPVDELNQGSSDDGSYGGPNL